MHNGPVSGQLSPDGKWRWDGLAWVPVASPRRGNSLALFLIILAVIVVGIIAIGISQRGQTKTGATVTIYDVGGQSVEGDVSNGDGRGCSHMTVRIAEVDHNGAEIYATQFEAGEVADRATLHWTHTLVSPVPDGTVRMAADASCTDVRS